MMTIMVPIMATMVMVVTLVTVISPTVLSVTGMGVSYHFSKTFSSLRHLSLPLILDTNFNFPTSGRYHVNQSIEREKLDFSAHQV